MIAEIIKILDPKQSRNGNAYIRVEFKDNKGNWYKTDLCRDYRNWHRWKNYLRVGNVLGNLIGKDDQTIDADSRPIFIQGRRRIKTAQEEEKELKEMFEKGILT